jgi:ech hydrogenase subunit B
LILAAVAIYVETGGFLIEDIFARGSPLLPNLWIAFIALLIALAIVMRKSPFDISASDHAHQEIVRGVLTEYSGPYLAIIELTHWYELTLLLGILGLFWIVGGMWWISIILPLFCFLLMLILDNISARLTWSWMVRFSWSFGLILVTLNILFVHLQWM